MNAKEIEFIEAHLPVGLQALPSPARMVGYLASVRRERNRHLAATFSGIGGQLKRVARAIRNIAIACAAARLHHKTA